MKKFTLLFAMLITIIGSARAQQITAQLVSGYGDPLTLTQFKALAVTAGRFGFVASSNTAAATAPRCDHWCKFTGTHNTTILDQDALFYLEEGTGAQAGLYRVKRASDSKYVKASTSATSFGDDGTYFRLVNRDPTDATKAVTGEKSISFEDPTNSAYHYNANAVKLNNGPGAWTTYAVFGPFYVVTIKCIDSNTKETIQTLENVIMVHGQLPTVTGYDLTTDPTDGAGITGDGVYEFEFTKFVTVTYQVKNGDEVIWSKDIQCAAGKAYPECTINSWASVVVPEGIVSGDETKDVEYTSTIRTFADVASVDQWYSLDIHGNENNYPLYSDGQHIRNPYYNVPGTGYRTSVTPNYAWAFIGNPITGVKLYNKDSESYAVQANDADEKITMGEEGSLFQVCTCTAIANAFALKMEGRSYYFNHRNDYIQGWTAADGGSAIRAYPVTVIEKANLTAMNAAVENLNSKVIGTTVGQYHETSEGAKAAALAEAAKYDDTTSWKEQSNVDAATAALNNAVTLNMPVDGHYYTLQGVVGDNTYGNKQYMIGATVSVEDKGNRLVLSAEPEGYNNVFQYVDGKLLSVTANCYVVNNAGFLNLGAADAEGVAIEFTPSTAVGTYLVKFRNGNTDRCTWSRFEGYIDGADYYANREVGYQWNIVESDYVPAANMRITEAEWGTFWAPFAVEIPEGVKAYTGEMKDGWIKMNEVEGVIPARTAVVVTMSAEDVAKCEGGVFTTDLQAVESDADALESCYTGNDTGAVMNVEQGAYLLQKNFIEEKGEEVVGWYKVDGPGFTLAPNRCYLAKGKVAESRTFIGFEPVDGDATGISTIASQAATKADGKYMVKGQIVVVKSGKAYNVNGTQIK